MNSFLLPLARRLWPEFDSQPGRSQAGYLSDLGGVFYCLPLAAIGLVWLVQITNLSGLRQNWPGLLLVSLLTLLFTRLNFFVISETSPGTYSDLSGSFDTLIIWAGALLFGPLVLWVPILLEGIQALRSWASQNSPRARSNFLRNLFGNMAVFVPGHLLALAVYRQLGGVFPIAGLSLQPVLLALSATAVRILFDWAIWTVYLGSYIWLYKRLDGRPYNWKAMGRFILAAWVVPAIAFPFAILAAGLYSTAGIGAFLFFALGLLLVSVMARQLSQAAERSRQQSRQIEKLQQLGQAILDGSPDGSALPEILAAHVPLMFTDAQVEIHIDPDTTLLHSPASQSPQPAELWDWLRLNPEPRAFSSQERLPWNYQIAQVSWLLAPILSAETQAVIGGICIRWGRHIQISNLTESTHSVPTIQTLAAQVASALRRAEVYTQTLAHQKMTQELVLAGQIQASFLPSELPHLAGWEMSAGLQSARETSGDFFDLIPLPDGALGFLIADVADKGTGAALYMALSRTLIRTYAQEIGNDPAQVLAQANRRILVDTQSDQFVTVFYAILEPSCGRVRYCNAGHNPGLILKPGEPGSRQVLSRTGLALGVMDGMEWQTGETQLEPGDVLLLYTDGVTEAQNLAGEFFGMEHFLAIAQAHTQESANALHATLKAEITAFAGKAPQADDITLCIAKRIA